MHGFTCFWIQNWECDQISVKLFTQKSFFCQDPPNYEVLQIEQHDRTYLTSVPHLYSFLMRAYSQPNLVNNLFFFRKVNILIKNFSCCHIQTKSITLQLWEGLTRWPMPSRVSLHYLVLHPFLIAFILQLWKM